MPWTLFSKFINRSNSRIIVTSLLKKESLCVLFFWSYAHCRLQNTRFTFGNNLVILFHYVKGKLGRRRTGSPGSGFWGHQRSIIHHSGGQVSNAVFKRLCVCRYHIVPGAKAGYSGLGCDSNIMQWKWNIQFIYLISVFNHWRKYVGETHGHPQVAARPFH